jgi:hypothetical protein
VRCESFGEGERAYGVRGVTEYLIGWFHTGRGCCEITVIRHICNITYILCINSILQQPLYYNYSYCLAVAFLKICLWCMNIFFNQALMTFCFFIIVDTD